MGLEIATYISQLNSAWPVGGVDNYSTADDHLRLLKAVLQAQFTSLGAAAVTVTAAEMNWLSGVTSSIQTQLNGTEKTANKNAANGYAGIDASGQLADARLKASNVTQFQSSLALAGSQITSGTVAPARLGSGSGTSTKFLREDSTFQNLATTDILSGTFADARLAASNVTQFQGSLSIACSQLTGTLPDARVASTNVTQHQASLSIACSQLTGTLADARLVSSNVTQFNSSIIGRNISSKSGTAKTLQAGGSPAGGADGDIIYIY